MGKIERAAPDRQIALKFSDKHAEEDEKIRNSLSAVRPSGDVLWVAADETRSIERLEAKGEDGFGRHRSFLLPTLFPDLSNDPGEVDVEGLALEQGYLWVVGSHGWARRKPKPDEHDPERILGYLCERRPSPNRHLLARIPVAPNAEGLEELAAQAGERRAACLPLPTVRGDELVPDKDGLAAILGADPLIEPFMRAPAKENGFDIEGLAVAGERIFLGLRGPVLRGWAILVELALEGESGGRLSLAAIGNKGKRYRLHLLDLDGLGIRDLLLDGADLLILAGPTMDLDGPVFLYRWRGALGATGSDVVDADELDRVLALPFGHGKDHPEGIGLLNGSGKHPGLLVVYDSPRKRRLVGSAGVVADVFSL